MAKKLVSVLFVFAFLASAVPASAQGLGYIPQTLDGWWYKFQGNQALMLTADNLGLVDGLSDQLHRAGYRSLAKDIIWNGMAYGLPMPNRGFYQMYDRNWQPLSGRQRIERAGGIVALADGTRRIINNPRGAAGWIEAAAGFVLVNDSRYRGQPKDQRDNGTIVTPPSPEQGRRIASDGTPVAVGTRPGGPTSPFWGAGLPGDRLNCMEQEMVTLENQSSSPLRVYRDTKPFETLLPKEQKCALLEGDYTGEIVSMVVGNDGLTGRVGVAPAKPESRPGLILVWR